MAKFVVDTNFFLQCKAADELPWHEVTTDTEVVLLVPRAVQGEIDKLEQDGSGRRSARARQATSTLRRAVLAEDSSCVIRQSAPRIVLRILGRVGATSATPPDPRHERDG